MHRCTGSSTAAVAAAPAVNGDGKQAAASAADGKETAEDQGESSGSDGDSESEDERWWQRRLKPIPTDALISRRIPAKFGPKQLCLRRLCRERAKRVLPDKVERTWKVNRASLMI